MGTAAVFITADGLVPGASMVVAWNGISIELTWDVGGCTPIYDAFVGALGDFARVTEVICGLPATDHAAISPTGRNIWWVLAGSNGFTVGSFGRDSQGKERTLTVRGPLRPVSVQDRSASCP